MKWMRSKESDDPLPARPVAVGWPARQLVQTTANELINRVTTGGKTDRGREDELALLPAQIQAAVSEFLATDAGRVYQHVLATGALPERTAEAIQAERERRAAFERRFM
jgi:hypothetical protein